ncbi:hypothetical protein CR513_21668, partial [Mucuna pruriens]
MGTGSTTKVVKIRFTVVNAPMSYNVILGKPALNRLRAIEDTRPRLDEDLKEVQTKIGASMDPQIEGALVRVLCENWDTFAWTPANMLGIDMDFLCHNLSISPSICPASQKKRRLAGEKKRVVKDEIARLLQARFIREVMYPS